jgi:hypothetical protein
MVHLGDFPIKISIYEGFSMAMLNNQMVNCFCSWQLDLFKSKNLRSDAASVQAPPAGSQAWVCRFT